MSNKNSVKIGSDYILEEILLKNDDGDFDLLPQFLEMSIYEDMFAFGLTGDLLLGDAIFTEQQRNLRAGDSISITIKGPGDSKKEEFSQEFIVTGIVHKRDLNVGKKAILVGFISKFLANNESTCLDTSISGPIEQVFNSLIARTKSEKTIEFGDQVGKDRLLPKMIPPKLRCLEYIKIILNMIQDTKTQNPCIVFFEDMDGHKLVSLDELCVQDPVIKLIRSISNIRENDILNPGQANSVKIQELDWKSKTNFTDYEMSGGLSMASDIVDLLFGTYTTSKDTTKDVLDRTSKQNDDSLMNNTAYMSKNTASNVLERGSVRILESNSSGIHMNSRFVDPYGYRVGNWSNRRRMRIDTLTNESLIAKVGGRLFYSPGQVFDLESFVKISENSPKINDFAGNYMATSVRHHIKMDSYSCFLELVTDSYNIPDKSSQDIFEAKLND